MITNVFHEAQSRINNRYKDLNLSFISRSRQGPLWGDQQPQKNKNEKKLIQIPTLQDRNWLLTFSSFLIHCQRPYIYIQIFDFGNKDSIVSFNCKQSLYCFFFSHPQSVVYEYLHFFIAPIPLLEKWFCFEQCFRCGILI